MMTGGGVGACFAAAHAAIRPSPITLIMIIRLLFMRNNTLSKVSKTTYTDWCEARGIISHVSEDGRLPTEWLNEKK